MTSLQSQCISVFCAACLKQFTLYQQIFHRIIATEQKWYYFTNFLELNNTASKSSFHQPILNHTGKILWFKNNMLPLEGTNAIKNNHLLYINVSTTRNNESYTNIIKPSHRNRTIPTCLSLINNIEPSENVFQIFLSVVLNSYIKILQIAIRVMSSTGYNNEVKCSECTNGKYDFKSNDIKQMTKPPVYLENQQPAMQNFKNVGIQHNVTAEFHLETALKNSSRRKKGRRKKLIFLLAGACLSCKRSKKDDSYDENDVITKQEQVAVVDSLDSSSVIDGVNINNLKSIPESTTKVTIEKDRQSSEIFCMPENDDHIESKTVTEEVNKNLDHIFVNLESSHENEDEKHLHEIKDNQKSDLSNDVQEKFLFDELPLASCITPEIPSLNKRKRKQSYEKEKAHRKSSWKSKKTDPNNESKSQVWKRPNYFVAIQVSDPQIHSAVQEVQQYIIEQEPKLKSALIKPCTLHLTVLVCHISDCFELERALQALEESFALIREKLLTNPLYMTFEGLGNFHNKVLFAELMGEDTRKRLNEIAYQVSACYEQHGLDLSDKKSLVPHLTLFKLSKDPTLWKKGIKKIEPSLYEEYKKMRFGVQLVKSLQLLSMLNCKDENGYYHCEKELLFDT